MERQALEIASWGPHVREDPGHQHQASPGGRSHPPAVAGVNNVTAILTLEQVRHVATAVKGVASAVSVFAGRRRSTAIGRS
jgi:hypothetical protein